MIKLFEPPHRGLDQRGMQILIHAIYFENAAGLYNKVAAVVSESDGTAREIPWTGITLDLRWNEKVGKWEDIGIPEEMKVAPKPEEEEPI